MKIAILILLHRWDSQQKDLVKVLAQQFNVFIHLDKRSGIAPDEIAMDSVHAFSSYKVYWGHFNQIQATLALYQKANAIGFDRYIFISGQDLPIINNKRIQDFFEAHNDEYFLFSKLPHKSWGKYGGFDRIDYYHPRYLTRGNINAIEGLFNKILHRLNNKILMPLMDKFGKRSRNSLTYWGGANWMNLSGICVSQMLEWIRENPWYLKRFRFTMCADEIFFQTVIVNFVKDVNFQNDSLRYIDWESGPEKPRIFRSEDMPKIMASNKLFARKFDENVDKAVIDQVFKSISIEK